MDSSTAVALITGAAALVAAAAGLVGHFLARRSAKDDDVREWVELQLERQDKQIQRLEVRINEMDRDLQAERTAHAQERQAHAEERLRSASLASYARVLLEWIGRNMPGATPPAAVGMVREVLER